MIRSFIVESTCNNMRIDRWLRNKLGKVPQSLIEKSLRLGKIKINKKKIKSSFKIKTNDKIELFNFDFKENIKHEKKQFNPSTEIIKSISKAIKDDDLKIYAGMLSEKLDLTQKVLKKLMPLALKGDYERFLADASVFMEFFSLIIISWSWLDIGIVANNQLEKNNFDGSSFVFGW